MREAGATPAAWFTGCAAMAAAALLLFGYMTPIVGSLVLFAAAGIAVGLLPPSVPALFDTRLVTAFAVTVLVAVILLGPGAFSVDARLYGRREIIVPPPGTPVGQAILSPAGRPQRSRRELRRRRQSNSAFILQAGQGQTITAADSGLFEDMLQVDLHRTGLDAEHPGNVPVSKALFH